MAALIPLIELNVLPAGRGQRVCAAGLDLAVFKVGEMAYAIDDSCPHAGASLANGRLLGRRVVCPAHGLKFDLGSDCADGTRGPATLEVMKYAVRTVDGMVMLDPGS